MNMEKEEWSFMLRFAQSNLTSTSQEVRESDNMSDDIFDEYMCGGDELMENATETNTYTCDICGFTEDWDDSDDVHGVMWVCEVCDTVFCKKCFQDAVGFAEYYRMVRESEQVKCPECYKKTEMEES